MRRKKKAFDDLTNIQKVISIVLPSLILFAVIFGIVYSMYFVDERELKETTTHFELYATRKDHPAGLEILNDMEASYVKFYDLMGFEGKEKTVKILMFPSLEAYNDFMMPLLPKWRDSHFGYASAEGKSIKVVSPLAKDTTNYTKADFLKSCKYQLALDLLNQNRYSIEKEPMWLTQGLGMYLCTDESEKDAIRKSIQEKTMPDFKTVLSMGQGRASLYNQKSDAFGDEGGREYSLMMIEFILDVHDNESLKAIYEKPEAYLDVLGYESTDSFLNAFNAYLKAAY